MRCLVVPIGITLLLLVTASSGVRAQDAESADDRILAWLGKQRTEHTGKGIAIIDVAITTGGARCDHPKLMIGILSDAKTGRATAFGYDVNFFTPSFGGIKTLPAGEYYVDHAECHSYNTTRTFRGPLARFLVREGEAVNVGRLKMAFTLDHFWWQTSGKTQRTVEPLPPTTVAWLTKKVPRLYGLAVNRPMTLEGPATNAVQRQ
jgi:hypothetical protein